MNKTLYNQLQKKQREKKLKEIRVLKSKLDYQYETYGEVDELDYNFYARLIGMYTR